MENMNAIDIIMAIEGGELEVTNYAEWIRVKDIVTELAKCQGFYGRLLTGMKDFERAHNMRSQYIYPILF